MIRPRYLPPDSYIDDPSEKLDRADAAESQKNLTYAVASDGLRHICSWIAQARRKRVKQRALRLDAVLLCIFPEFCARIIPLPPGLLASVFPCCNRNLFVKSARISSFKASVF